MKTIMKVATVSMQIPTWPIQGRIFMSLLDAHEAIAYGVPSEKIGVVINQDGDWIAMETLEVEV